MKSSLTDVLTRRALRRLAGARSFGRGADYFRGGQVRSLLEERGTLTATVLGTRRYRVKLRGKGEELQGSCTCPVGAGRGFCKHCVAVGLAWLRGNGGGGAPRGQEKPRGRSVTLEDVRAHLAAQEKSALVKLILDQARGDDRLRRRLFLEVTRKSSKKLDLTAYKRAIDRAVDVADLEPYGEAPDYAAAIDEAIDSIEEILKEGHAAEAVELLEHALRALEEALESIDDSDGEVGGLLERLQRLHLKASKKARPDPEALARRLFEWELEGDWDTFHGAAETYAGVLGEKGLEVYRKLAGAEWARVHALGPGEEDPERYGRRRRITHILEALARQSGDVEALVEVQKRDLSSAYAYLEIAETYKQHRKRDLALEWAERGLKAFPVRTDSRLREFLAEEYHRRGRHGEALELVWSEFAESPGLERFQMLKSHADRTGEWAPWLEKALAFLREGVAKARAEAEARRSRWGGHSSADHSELVRVFLWEKDLEAAWREAREGGCTSELWLELARKREAEHPADALSVYQARIEPTLAGKNNDAYRYAVGLLRKVQGLLARLGREEEFPRYVEQVRAAHKPKRNFLKMLDRTTWS